MKTKSMAHSGKSTSSTTEQNAQSLSSLRFLTMTLSAPPLAIPKDVVAGTFDRVVVMDRSKNGDCVIMSVAELAHLLNFDMDRVVKQKYGYLLFDLSKN
jgi:hypothetical protein